MEEDKDKLETSVQPRKKVSRRKRVKRRKERGKYLSTEINIGDIDLASCIFSDEEEATSETSCTSTSTRGSSESLPSSAANESCELECSIEVPSNPESTPSSSVSSRPGSAAQHRPSRPSLSAASDMHLLLGASDPSSDKMLQCTPSLEIVGELVERFKKILPSAWMCIASHECVHLFFISTSIPKAIQREIVIFFNGKVSINVHCESLLKEKVLTLDPIPPLDSIEKVPVFCDRGMKIVIMLMNYVICVGANHCQTRSVWNMIEETYIDMNPYQEESYSETCRSNMCHRLVKSERGNKIPRCISCTHVLKTLKKREASLTRETPSPFTPNVYLTVHQALDKMSKQHEEIRKRDKRILYLESRVADVIAKEGVEIEEEVCKDLHDILNKANLTPIQKLFMEQQLKMTNVQNPRCRRWHPTIIRLALHLQMTSSSSYEALRDSGALLLPTSRTLFDYSHVIDPQEGVNDGILSRVQKQVQSKQYQFQKYHSLICDEMYVSKNLVHRQNDNSLVGFQHLDEVEAELAQFEAYVEGQFSGRNEKDEKQLAKTMRTFMVKGLCTDVKSVVAAFPMNAVTAESIYSRTWQVIGRLEKADIKVHAMVLDGAAPNRSFVGMHTPITNTKCDIIFDTVNFCSPERRPLFFIFDVCHVLKTVRNCFYNSGDDVKKPRCMEFNGEKIMWKTIVRLYLDMKNCNFRKAYKLNAQNVFPNAFNCMSVKNAARVLSNTVANDIEKKGWPNTTETVKFIRYFNKFFDVLNGAFRDQAVRTKNEDLAPYTDPNDKRFSWLGVPNPGHEQDHGTEMPFLQYLQTWKDQVQMMPISTKLKEKKKLSWQVMHSSGTSIRGFAGAVRSLLDLQEPPQFILGRAFSQDPLEQNFSLWRSGFGGSHNPNVDQCLRKQVSLTIQKELGVKKRKSNVEASGSGLQITEGALQKKQRSNRKK